MHQESNHWLLPLAWIGGCTLLLIAWNIVTSVEFLRIVLWPFTPILERMRTGEIDNLTAVGILMVMGCVVGGVAAGISIVWTKATASTPTKHRSTEWTCDRCGHRYTDLAAAAAHSTVCH